MRVGGVRLDPDYSRRLWLGLFAVVGCLGLFISFSAAVVFFTSFCFGAGFLSIALDLSHGHRLPNMLPFLKVPSLLEPYPCSRCKRRNCDAHDLSPEPWADFCVPVEVDAALGDFFERLLREYVYPWYREVSYDEEFAQDVRRLLRHASAAILKRAHRIDAPSFILRKAVPVGVAHVDALLRAGGDRRAFLEHVGPRRLHPAARSRAREVEYVRSIAAKLVAVLVPQRYQSSRCMTSLLTDLLSGAVLQPLLDLLPDPDACVNVLIALAFSPEPNRRFDPASGHRVEFLERFVKADGGCGPSLSALQMDLSAVLKDDSARCAFMRFLKEEGAINQLQFCLTVEDFNKRITKELNDNEKASLHQEAVDLYDVYFRTGSMHRVAISSSIALDIFAILRGPPEGVVQLRTSALLVRAYEEVYSSLESKMCPEFYKSKEYYRFLLGSREKEDVEDDFGKQPPRGRIDISTKSDKFGKGLTRFKQGVLGRSTEGIIDCPAVPDPAFDLAGMCTEEDEEDEEEVDEEEDDPERMLLGGGGIGGIDPAKFRDLSAWRVSIPRLTTSIGGSGGRACFVFVVDVQRIDIKSRQEDAEDLHWCVERKYWEFYALESKLTEFHGDFDDVKLPPRSKLFSGAGGRGLDSMQSKMRPFEDYLTGLLRKPSLRGSALLFAFLTSKEEFAVAASRLLGIGKIIKSRVTRRAEKGQSLCPFIDGFIASTLSEPPKPRLDSVTGALGDAEADRSVESHPVFGEGFGINEDGFEDDVARAKPPRSLFDAAVFLAANLFSAPAAAVRILFAIGQVAGSSLEHLVEHALAWKLSRVLCANRVAFLCRLAADAVFEPASKQQKHRRRRRTDEEKLARKAAALENLRGACAAAKASRLEEGARFVFEGLQDPVLNKHLALQLFDLAVAELFPDVVKRCR